MEPLSKKKILFVITKSNWGGAQRYVYDLATHLPKDRFEVAVALGGIGGKDSTTGILEEKLRQGGVRTVLVRNFMRDISFGHDAGALFELIRIFRAERPDVVHTNSSKAGGLGAVAARISGVPRVIFTAHGWPFWEKRGGVARALLYFFSWLTALFSHVVIVISDYDRRVAGGMPFISRKIVRIYNGVNFHTPLGSGEVIRNAFPVGTKITGTVGELNTNKNQIALIEEARARSDMYVAIVGDGENRNFLEQKIKEYALGERVKLFGFIPASEVLRGFDTFALPSIKEGLPYVLLEAKAVGLPIVANRVGGVGEILDAKDMSEFSLERMVKKTQQLY